MGLLPRNFSRLKLLITCLLCFIFTIFLLSLLFAFFNSQVVLGNVYFANENLFLNNRVEVEKLVSGQIEKYSSSFLTLDATDQELELGISELGIEFNEDEVVDNIFEAGTRDSVLGRFRLILTTPFKKTYAVPSYDIDFSRLTREINLTISALEKESLDATIVFHDGVYQTLGQQEGTKVDQVYLIEQLRTRLNLLSNEPISLRLVKDKPQVKSENTLRAFERVGALSNQQIILKYDRDSWKLTGEDLLDILRFHPYGLEKGYVFEVDLGTDPVFVKSIDFGDDVTKELEVTLDKSKIDEFIVRIAKVTDREKVDASLKFEGNKIVEFTPAVDGQKLNRELLRKLVLEKVSVDYVGFEKDIMIELPVEVTEAKVKNEEINSLGIKELIGRGVSYYTGSIPNRIYNIKLGSGRVSGTLVKPGEVFSFNKTVGEVSGASGYRQAYVISKGRTVLDDGGGVCQVSTTVFRAVLKAGLPVVERTAHAYRVSYYEKGGFKPGLDATVWSPAVDFKFKNDTGHYILIQITAYEALAKLQVDLYGTFDKRRVELTEPTILSQSEALPDKYEDDPTLPKGTVKQVDFAAPGAVTVFNRKVYQGDEIRIDESFKSNFRPWQAIYLVGTKEN